MCVYARGDRLYTDRKRREKEKKDRERKREREHKTTAVDRFTLALASLVGHSIGRLVVLLSTCNRYFPNVCIGYFAFSKSLSSVPVRTRSSCKKQNCSVFIIIITILSTKQMFAKYSEVVFVVFQLITVIDIVVAGCLKKL